jgi:Ca2+-binding RTX toxin-like protein
MTYYYNGTSWGDYLNYMGSDRLFASGGGGNDTIWGNTNNDEIYGGDGNDSLFGWTGNDTLYGNRGSDYLNGGAGSDYIQGTWATTYNSYEYDTLVGGAGMDTFVLGDRYTGNFYQGLGYATITDYNGFDDYIQVKGSSWNFTLDKSSNFGGSSSLDTAIYRNGDLLAVVQDTTSIQLTSYYFKFV